MLLARDEVNLSSEDCSGRTPSAWAIENGHEEVAKLLRARELDNKKNQVPQWLKMRNRHVSTRRLIKFEGNS